jgi:hypothetical protein
MSPDSFTTIAIIGVNAPNPNATFPHYYRLGGTLVMHNGLRSATVVYDMSWTTATTPGRARSADRRCCQVWTRSARPPLPAL